MAKQQITAQPRTIVGKKVKGLRRQGLVPAVVYGPALTGVQPVTVTAREFEHVYAHAGTSTMIDLVLEGQPAHPVLIHQVQHDHLRRDVIHVDFLAPDMRHELTVAIPLHLVGESPAARAGGILTQVVTEVQVRCLPADIPQMIEVDLTGLTETGMSLTAADLTPPAGVTLLTPVEETIVMVEQPTVEEAPELEEPLAEVAAAEQPEATATVETEGPNTNE